MSSKLAGLVFEMDLPHELAWVLMAYLDNSPADGSDIFTGTELLGWMTGYSRRQIQLCTARLVSAGILKVTIPGGGRGRSTHYRFDMTAVPWKESIESRKQTVQTLHRLAETAQFEGLNRAETAQNSAETALQHAQIGDDTLTVKQETEIDIELREMWAKTKTHLRLQLPRSTYETWVRDTVALTRREDEIVIGVPNAYAQEWLKLRLLPMILRTLASIMGSKTKIHVTFEIHQFQT